jgi:S1-C subfamily serine protease
VFGKGTDALLKVFHSLKNLGTILSRAPRDAAHSRVRLALALLSVVAACGVAQSQPSARPATAASTTVAPQTQAQPARAQAATTVTPARAQQTASTAATARAEAPPVVAVIHRLSGWKLRAVVAPPDAPIATTFDDKFVRTNIVAGYVLPDGRSVVARLPQAEADVLNFTAQFPELKPSNSPGDSDLKLVRADGAEFDAKFIGLDGNTGLSLFETSQPVLPPAKEMAQALVVGQRVCIWAPLPADAPSGDVGTTAPPSLSREVSTTTPTPPPAETAGNMLVGDAGVLYMNLGEIEGTLKAVRRSPSGRAIAFRIEAQNVSPEWAGGVALTEQNALIGIVEQSDKNETRLLSAEAVRAAASRVQARRASVPQPWLGARGDAVAMTPTDLFVERGWTREQASTLVRRQQGVVLTSVAPGTPAARAGLRPGDVIARVGAHDVRNVEDMTWMLKELGGNVPAYFTVLRAGAAPLNLRVMLSEAQNPAAETAQAEVYAAHAELMRTQAEADRVQSDMTKLQREFERLRTSRPPSPPSRAAVEAAQVAREREALREKLREAQERFKETELGVTRTKQQLEEAQVRLRAASAALPAFAVNPLLTLGVETCAFISTNLFNGMAQTRKGLIVVALHPETAAARSELRVGDIIETVNGQPSLGVDWKTKLPADDKKEISLGVLRDGKKLTLKLRPAPEK